MGYGTTISPRAYAFPTWEPTRSLRESLIRNGFSEDFALSPFFTLFASWFPSRTNIQQEQLQGTTWNAWSINSLFHLAFPSLLNIWTISRICMPNTKIHKQDSQVRNKQSRTSKQVPTRDCLRSLSYAILRHMPTRDLRTKQNSLRRNDLSSSSI